MKLISIFYWALWFFALKTALAVTVTPPDLAGYDRLLRAVPAPPDPEPA